jgi:hypothetical protein
MRLSFYPIFQIGTPLRQVLAEVVSRLPVPHQENTNGKIQTYVHREGVTGSFTKRYGVKRLVHMETHDRAEQAIQREKI